VLPVVRVGVHGGSPPHAWGRRRRPAVGRGRGRLTPTRVGTTTSVSPGLPVVSAHPHTRGDDISPDRRARESTGSPPHAWGRPHNVNNERSEIGLTPTRVGTTTSLQCPSTPVRAHPHTRGDDWRSGWSARKRLGSPPHAWGRRLDVGKRSRGSRLTPTRVGTTRAASVIGTNSWAHPHTRGDDQRQLRQGLRSSGSPPHAWGRLIVRIAGQDVQRLTPTRVGTTLASAPRS